MGHVTWHQEMFVFPALLALYPDLAKTVLQTRNRTVQAALSNASKDQRRGIQYPWESGATGV